MDDIDELIFFNFVVMKYSLQYLHDFKGNPLAVQLPFTQWENILYRLRRYEQTLKIKSDLFNAFEEVAKIRKGKIKKQTLSDFLNEL